MPVGSYESGKSPYGLYDMMGNVWEWVSSLYMPYPYDAHDGREEMNSSDPRVMRGGSWYFNLTIARSVDRVSSIPAIASNEVGFRCVLSP
jgi:formylglycine-generating enzyme required for sulfatase activity